MRRQSARASFSWSTRLLLIAPLLILLAGGTGGFIWWEHFKTTPAYSLALLVDAAERNDATAFDSVLDINQVVENFAQDSAPGPLLSAAALPDLVRTGLQAIGTSVAESIKPTLRETVRKRINEIASHSASYPFVLMAVGLSLRVDVVTKDDKATASIEDKDRILNLTMSRVDEDHWRIIAVKDDQLASRILADVAAELRNRAPSTLPDFTINRAPNIQSNRKK